MPIRPLSSTRSFGCRHVQSSARSTVDSSTVESSSCRFIHCRLVQLSTRTVVDSSTVDSSSCRLVQLSIRIAVDSSSCRLVQLSTRTVVDSCSCQLVQLSTRLVVDSHNCRLVQLSTCPVLDSSSCQPFQLLTRRVVNSSSCRLVQLSTHPSVNSSSSRIIHLSSTRSTVGSATSSRLAVDRRLSSSHLSALLLSTPVKSLIIDSSSDESTDFAKTSKASKSKTRSKLLGKVCEWCCGVERPRFGTYTTGHLLPIISGPQSSVTLHSGRLFLPP